jgi:predicted nucleotidyltransferase
MSLPESIASKTKAPPTINDLRRLLVPFCNKYPIAKLEVFGSVAEGTAKAGSDVDLMVTFKAGSEASLFDFLDLKLELEDLLGCPVDLLERPLVESMKNPFKRRSILSCVLPVYAS